MKHIYFSLLLLLMACANKNTSSLPTQARDSLYLAFVASLEDPNDSIGFALYQQKFTEQFPEIARIYPEVRSYWYAKQALMYNFFKSPDSAGRWIDSAVAAWPQAAAPDTGLAMISLARTWIHLKSQRIDSGLHHAINTYQITKTAAPDKHPITVDLVANIYTTMGDTGNVRKYIDEGLAIGKQPHQRVPFLNYLVAYYERKGQKDSMRIAIARTLQDSAYLDPNRLSVIYANLSQLEYDAGNLRSALSHISRSLELSWAYSVPGPHAHALMGDIQAGYGNFPTAMRYYDSAIARAELVGYLRLAGDIGYRAASTVSALKGNYKLANQYLRQSLKDYAKADSVDMETRIQEVETRMGVQLKDQEIEVLSSQQEAAQAEAERNSTFIIALIVALVLVVVVVVTVIWRIRSSRQLSELRLQQRILRLQMEPHFMFNVLSQIMAYLQQGMVEKARGYLGKFARMLQRVLVNTRKALVPLADEITVLDDYMYLQQANSGENFSYKIDAYEGYEDDEALIPPMVIQPFVENAIHHGVGRLASGGHIDIVITRQRHTVSCDISDNGPGLADRGGAAQKPSLSSDITRERLAILRRQSGYPASLTVVDRSEEGARGVRVKLIVPISDVKELDPEQAPTAHANHRSRTY